jgi:hypothetical protein
VVGRGVGKGDGPGVGGKVVGRGVGKPVGVMDGVGDGTGDRRLGGCLCWLLASSRAADCEKGDGDGLHG